MSRPGVDNTGLITKSILSPFAAAVEVEPVRLSTYSSLPMRRCRKAGMPLCYGATGWLSQVPRNANPTPLKPAAKAGAAPGAAMGTAVGTAGPKPEAVSGTPRVANAAVLHENIYTIPNFLTATRLVAAPIVGYLVLQDMHLWAVGLFAYAGVTDLLDGWIARRWNSKTVVGTVIDPMADKALMTILTVCLAIKGALPLWVATIILGRDVGLGIAAIYYRWISLPAPKTFARYWDFSLPSAEVRPTTISKCNTVLQLALVGLSTAAPVIGADMSSTLTALQYIVVATTIWSGASYVYTKDAVKILKQSGP
ncbi:hypothetical protein DCS_03048 [Drechmeria coniospora]|uniref:Phosphatidyl synthase n=1 Tax=Drechmeria coniospora TaxID=98403 RepID=A0A151GXZ1_DRECN|nr:hypothetical protein DCS_03048 [Drechmeria coniospora]KYK61903.1 hypothetical protein DCS_03048 [Drechmeria coniospora]